MLPPQPLAEELPNAAYLAKPPKQRQGANCAPGGRVPDRAGEAGIQGHLRRRQRHSARVQNLRKGLLPAGGLNAAHWACRPGPGNNFLQRQACARLLVSEPSFSPAQAAEKPSSHRG